MPRKAAYKEFKCSPYPGTVRVVPTHQMLVEQYEAISGDKWKWSDGKECLGRTVNAYDKKKKRTYYIVWATTNNTVVHELSHVALMVMQNVGIDPREANGEPYCYFFDSLYEAVYPQKKFKL